MDHYRSGVLSSILPDEEQPVRTMAEMISNISPPVTKRDIKRGDTLSGIAREYGVTVRELMRLNPDIKDPKYIVAGESLHVPMRGGLGESRSTDPYAGMEDDIQAALAPERPGIGEGALEGAYPEQFLPLVKPLAGLAGMGATKGISALARAAPVTARAGVTGNAVKGAVNWPGAKPSLSNVAPMPGVNGGAVKAMLAKMQGRPGAPAPSPMANTMMPNPTRALNSQGAALNKLGPEMYPGPVPPQVANNSLLQALHQGGLKSSGGRGSNIPNMGPGSGTGGRPPMGLGGGSGAPQNVALMNSLRQGGRKLNAGPQESIIQKMIQGSRGEPTLADLRAAGGNGRLAGSGGSGNMSFQELLRSIGYNG